MTQAICPGQNTRYWKPGDIFTIQCNECSKIVEFFKDDVSRRCPNCGSRIQNPKISMGCAQWCKHAEKCLGYDPKKLNPDIDTSSGELPLADRMISIMKEIFGENDKVYKNAILALENVEKKLDNEKTDPRVVIAASLLLKADESASDKVKKKFLDDDFEENEPVPIAMKIMDEAGLDKNTCENVQEIITSYLEDKKIDYREYELVVDAYKFI